MRVDCGWRGAAGMSVYWQEGHNLRGVVVFKNFEMFLGCEIEPSSVSLFVCNDM